MCLRAVLFGACGVLRCVTWLCSKSDLLVQELLRQMCAAAKAIGNTELENKFAEGTLNLV